MIYPREYVQIGDCIALIKKVGGTRREAGPETHWRSQVEYNGESWKSSRLAYHLNCAPLPKTPPSLKEGIVCHHCDNDWCINPKHLYLGTAKQNTRDIYERNKFIRNRKSEAHKGNQNAKGHKFTEESRKRVSLSKIGNKNAKGKKWSQASKELARKSHLGKKFSESAIENMRKAQKLSWQRRKGILP